VPVVREASFCGVLAHRRDCDFVVQLKIADLHRLEKAAHNSLLLHGDGEVLNLLEWDKHVGCSEEMHSPFQTRKSEQCGKAIGPRS
jgi:hypothetical protein